MNVNRCLLPPFHTPPISIGGNIREALIEDGLSRDMEDELRRLVVVLNEMLNHRVAP